MLPASADRHTNTLAGEGKRNAQPKAITRCGTVAGGVQRIDGDNN
jgi:hypothetical protein